MKAHPFADVFPMLDDAELQKLAEDIQENGQHQPILVTKDGLILDGRNRWAACERVGIAPETKVVSGDDKELLQMVLGLNLHRRHLNESQRAMVASKLAALKPGQRATAKSPAGIQAGGGLSQQTAAKALNVSRDSVQKATKVRREASPEIITKVERGELSVHAAVQQTKAATAPAPTTTGSIADDTEDTETPTETPEIVDLPGTMNRLRQEYQTLLNHSHKQAREFAIWAVKMGLHAHRNPDQKVRWEPTWLICKEAVRLGMHPNYAEEIKNVMERAYSKRNRR